MAEAYPSEMTMLTARDLYFRANGFGDDGGYNDAWVDFKIGPVPLPFPNTASRLAAVRFHDLHHVLTGYQADPTGEFEISAWEIGAGCSRYLAALAINIGALTAGALTSPRRTFAAFVRGRRSRTLYDETYEPLLDKTVGELRARCVAPNPSASEPATLADYARFGTAAAIGAVVGTIELAFMLPLVPVGVVLTWLRRRRAADAGVTA